MVLRNYPDFLPGLEVPPEEWQRIDATARGAAGLQAGGDTGATGASQYGQTVFTVETPRCVGRLQTVDSFGNYTWQEVLWNGSGYVNRDPGLSGSPTVFPARERNGNPNVFADPVLGTVVALELAEDGATWIFDCCGGSMNQGSSSSSGGSSSSSSSIVVLTDWMCVNGSVYLTKKRITGSFTISDP